MRKRHSRDSPVRRFCDRSKCRRSLDRGSPAFQPHGLAPKTYSVATGREEGNSRSRAFSFATSSNNHKVFDATTREGGIALPFDGDATFVIMSVRSWALKCSASANPLTAKLDRPTNDEPMSGSSNLSCTGALHAIRPVASA
jgi:hypothetical protein